MKIAIVAGATGLIGKQCMYKLLENIQYQKVIALVRKPLEITHPKLDQVIADYDNPEKMILPYQEVTDVFCCLGTTMKNAGSKEAFYKVDFTYVNKLAAYFSEKGATNFLLVSAIGADKDSSVYYSKVKGQTEEVVKRYSYNGVFIFRPSILLGKREEFRFGERVGIAIAMLAQPFLLGALKKYRPIYGAEVAAGMINESLSNKTGIYILEGEAIAG